MIYLKYVPKNWLSRVVGRATQLEQPTWLTQRARDVFVKYYGINMNEAEHPIEFYQNIGEVFTRRIKVELRPIGDGVVHPCDGRLTTVETIEGETLLQAKRIRYPLETLVNAPVSSEFIGGVAFTYYLCPTDYHRVHAPVSANVTSLTHVPGTLWPVNEKSVLKVPKLFAINERLVFDLTTPHGRIFLVMVGATNVGRMSVSFDPNIVTNSAGRKSIQKFNYNPAVHVEKGDELGTFHMGSTVIVIYPPQFLKSQPHKGPVKMGESV